MWEEKGQKSEHKYADLLDDNVFKLVFGQESSKDVMIEFLNQVIPDRSIVDLEFMDKEMHPVELDGKGSVYDMFCRTDDGSRIIVEVQRRKQPFYPERAIYYSTFQIQKQVKAGAEYYDFLPVYVVNILDFLMDENIGNSSVKTVYRLYEQQTHDLLTDRVTFIFIELAKFKKTIEELDGNILEGMYFCFKNMHTLAERPDILRHKVFEKIFEVTALLNMDNETRSKISHNMTTERDRRNQDRYAREIAIAEGLAEGRAVGLEEGRAEGRAEGQLIGERTKAQEIARNMLEAGIEIAQICRFTELDVEEIHVLAHSKQ